VLLHRFLFTGVIHIVYPETRLQLFFGAFFSLISYATFILRRPFAHDLCNAIGSAVLLQLLLTYNAALLFLDDGSVSPADLEWRQSTFVGVLLITANSICFALLALAATRTIYRARRTADLRRLRYVDNREYAAPEPLTSADGTAKSFSRGFISTSDLYHLFLSHTWLSGQDAMRIVKQRLLEMLPTLSVFLDVDIEDLAIEHLESYVDHSQSLLIFCTAGYFTSKNCMRELSRGVMSGKRLIAVLDPDTRRGGLSLHDVHQQMDSSRFITSNAAVEISSALFAEPSIEWNRLGSYQDVSLACSVVHTYSRSTNA